MTKRTEEVEIFSDATNGAIMRHPGRRFPGVLVQGDTLYTWCQSLDVICEAARSSLNEDAFIELNELRNRLWGQLSHYKQVRAEHDMPLPFSEQPR
jgi:hypothetical protein